MKMFESKWQGKDGTEFFIHGWAPTSGKPKAVVALVHGIGEHCGRYHHVAQAFADAGYALVAFDQRGHGKSGGTRGHIPSLDVALGDIRQFFEQVTRQYPDLPQFLYGHSLGGLLSLTYSLKHSAGLKGVIATSPALRSSVQEQKAKVVLARVLGSLIPTIIIPTGIDISTVSRDSNVVQKYQNDPLVHDKASLGLGKAVLTAIDFCFEHAKEFPLPLLIMHGTSDKLTYASGSEGFAKFAQAGGAEVTLKLWDGLYHELHNEPEQMLVFQTMTDWLDSHLK